jgi:hypothetical protein
LLTFCNGTRATDSEERHSGDSDGSCYSSALGFAWRFRVVIGVGLAMAMILPERCSFTTDTCFRRNSRGSGV